MSAETVTYAAIVGATMMPAKVRIDKVVARTKQTTLIVDPKIAAAVQTWTIVSRRSRLAEVITLRDEITLASIHHVPSRNVRLYSKATLGAVNAT